jgi:hypothetical protein
MPGNSAIQVAVSESLFGRRITRIGAPSAQEALGALKMPAISTFCSPFGAG